MELLGRTNRAFPPVWLSLREPDEPNPGWVEPLVQAAVASQTVLDISSRPALFGGFLRGTEAALMAVGGADAGTADNGDRAAHLIHGKLVSLLSSIGRDYLDFFFLDYRQPWEEAQINGAFEALETARQDGLIRHLGLAAKGNDLAALGMWQFHDAFEVLLVPRSFAQTEAYGSLAPLAKERRVGVVTAWPESAPCLWDAPDVDAAIQVLSSDHPFIVPVVSPDEVEVAMDLQPRLDRAALEAWEATAAGAAV